MSASLEETLLAAMATDENHGSEVTETVPPRILSIDPEEIEKDQVAAATPTKTVKPAVPSASTAIKSEETGQFQESPTTPTKASKPASKRKTVNSEGEAASSPSSAKKTKTTPTTPTTSSKKGAKLASAPTKPEDLDASDRLIYDLVQAGKKWGEIANALQALDGVKRAASTPRMRYQRFIEPAIFNVKEDHYDILEAAHNDVDVGIRREKSQLDQGRWAKVAKKMEEMGTEAYPPKLLIKAYKQLQAAKAAAKAEDKGTEALDAEE